MINGFRQIKFNLQVIFIDFKLVIVYFTIYLSCYYDCLLANLIIDLSLGHFINYFSHFFLKPNKFLI